MYSKIPRQGTMIEIASSGALLVFGGPYSNLPATRALRDVAAGLGVSPDRAICTGDVVAYGADPEATVDLIRDWGCHVIAGNCEEQLAAGADDCGCGFEEGTACAALSKGWYPYANARVSIASRAWMAALPKSLRLSFGGAMMRVVHGGTDVTNQFLFESQSADIAHALDRAHADVVLAGHCGLPFAVPNVSPTGRRQLWVNAGVIGMPANDGTPDTWYALIHARQGGLRIEWHRLPYDHIAAAAAMRRAGHANPYARTLITGVWPSFDILPPAERAATGRRIEPAAVTVQTPLPAHASRDHAKTAFAQ